jgi:hypothetical protein
MGTTTTKKKKGKKAKKVEIAMVIDSQSAFNGREFPVASFRRGEVWLLTPNFGGPIPTPFGRGQVQLIGRKKKKSQECKESCAQKQDLNTAVSIRQQLLAWLVEAV